MKVVIATDGQASSEHTIREAVRLLSLDRSTVHVISVLDPEERIGGNVDADEDLARATALLASEGITAQASLLRGHFAEQIVGFAEQISADVIVVGSSAQQPLVQWLSGSVSNEVIRRFNGSVLVVTHHRR
jgi:nucleotide-binding universal stress UspA family protein